MGWCCMGGAQICSPQQQLCAFLPLAARGQNATVYVFYTVSQAHKLRQIKARLNTIFLFT